ncbi:hypothetical protein GTA08_BOTSDO13860 [Neofusicoccum parvum]|uniref:Uncharacterized protein n=1 Tax=Neofusicoccum parvum TaxID=310453 RepID=A0ACB5RTT6_9PEZI|nr:hypothetical protein GTA08_BOTSDO13860 [Neofusicoccum parvum]
MHQRADSGFSSANGTGLAKANGKSEPTLNHLIPPTAGTSPHRLRTQHRTLVLWAALALSAALAFHLPLPLSPPQRAALLGLAFPGAGYVACANVAGGALLALTLATQPLALFAWFGAGGVAFVVLHWGLAVVGAYLAAGEAVFAPAAVIDLAVLAAGFVYARVGAERARREGERRRLRRNEYLPAAVRRLEGFAVATPSGARELEMPALRSLQYIIETSLKDIDDFSDIDTVDQFQTAARRYKLYERMYVLAAYLGTHAPNAHGPIKRAYERLVEKSLTPASVGFWRWERLWGRFSIDCDPVARDNVMVTGFLLKGVALYTALTGDARYTRPGALRFRVAEGREYAYDLHSMDEAVVRQWASNPWCLFPCEPGWIYTMCNLQGRIGQTVYDRVFGTARAQDTARRFEASLDANFTEPDGSPLTIRSEPTGFTVPGLCGAINVLAVSMLCRGHLDHVARRCYAVFREENVRLDAATGDVELVGLVGADKIDPGNYKSSDAFLYGQLAIVAGEFGDEAVRVACVNHLKRTVGTVTLPSGATRLRGVSDLVHSLFTRAQFIGFEDWKTVIEKGPPKTTLNGPILSAVPYPGVLVAKAWSHTSADLDLVLYPSDRNGVFELGVEKLQPRGHYRISPDQTVVADEEGRVEFSVAIEGRTEVKITPVS